MKLKMLLIIITNLSVELNYRSVVEQITSMYTLNIVYEIAVEMH